MTLRENKVKLLIFIYYAHLYFYFFNFSGESGEVSKFTGKKTYKKTQHKYLITFGRIMIPTSNLEHLMSKDILPTKAFL